jgi:hypothetical protein
VLGTAAANGETITLSYNSVTGDFKDTSDNDLASITNQSVTNNVAAPPVSSPPTYEGTPNVDILHSNTTNLNIGWPAGILADDIIILTVTKAANETIPLPSGFTAISQLSSAADSVMVAWYRADGTESGGFSVTGVDDGTSKHANIYTFRGVLTTGDPTESVVTASPTSSTGQSLSNGLSSGDDRLAVMVYFQGENIAVTNNSTGYTQQYISQSPAGTDASIAILTEVLADNTTVDGTVQYTTATAQSNSLVGFMLKPDA